MTAMVVAWSASAFLLVIVAVWLGNSIGRGSAGILIDTRGRYSLTQFQLVLWTVVVLSLVAALFIARVVSGVPDALTFEIPGELLAVLGISVASSVTSSALKTGKDASRPAQVAASDANDKPRWTQMFLVEEGELADAVIDISKYQNFWLTVILVAAYVVLVCAAVFRANEMSELTLPGFDTQFLTLLGISHAGYLAGKLPDRPGTPKGLTVALVRNPAAQYVPRNPA